MPLTLFDICRRTGLSTATVSRVLNESPLVSEQTRRRVLRAIQRLGYRPSHAARALARRRNDTLGVVFPQVTGGFHVEILRGIDEVAAEHGFHILTAFSHGLRDQETLIRQVAAGGRVDALIILNLDIPAAFFRRFQDGRLPTVVIDTPARAPGLVSITMDNETGAAAAFAHLLRHVREDLAILTGPKGNFDSERRLKGCRAAARKAGVAASAVRVLRGDWQRGSGERLLRDLLHRNRVPRGIMALNDAMALGAIAVLQEAGLRVPGDVAVIGFDDIEAAHFLGLSTVRIPVREMGRAAAENAILRVVQRRAMHNRVLPTELVLRRSCGCAAHGTAESGTQETRKGRGAS